MTNKIDLTWTGELIKQKVTIPDTDLTPKMLIESLEQAQNQVDQMEDQLVKMDQQKKGLMKNIESAKEFVKSRRPFEQKSIEIQIDKLKQIISVISKECRDKSIKLTEETVNKDINAYTDAQIKNMYYVNYQRLLATNEKVAKKIAPQIIKEHLFDTPVFDNPF